jgi:hypothetical protein
MSWRSGWPDTVTARSDGVGFDATAKPVTEGRANLEFGACASERNAVAAS